MTKHFADFVNAQAAFGPALKNKRNSHLKNTYADLESCLEAVTDALHANGFALMQIPKNCDTQSVTIETVFVHASGQIISGGDMRVPVIKTDPQGVGSSLSYARRYSLLAACGIAQA